MLNLNDKLINKGKILWTNPNPSEARDGGYEIKLSSNDYDVLEVFCEYSRSNQDLITSFKGIKGKNISLVVNSSNNTLTEVARILSYINDKTYNLSIGHMRIGNTTTISDNNTGCIPIYIVGYKTNLFKPH